MKIAGYDVNIIGDFPDEDTVLIEDAVLFINGKISQTKLLEVRCLQEGYDLLIQFNNRQELAHIRRDAQQEWFIYLPDDIDTIVQEMPV